MKVGSLFSGGGLGDLGFMMAWMEIGFQVEIEDYCQKILKLRWPGVPKWKDIKDVRGADLPPVDIITGGFPCQSFSVAGQQRGKEDSRSLWPEMFRIIRELGPRWVVGENVPGIIGIALDDVLSDLESEGYETTTLVFPAHVVPPQVPHRRERVWFVAHTGINGLGERQEAAGLQNCEQDVAYAEKPGLEGPDTEGDVQTGRWPSESRSRRWEVHWREAESRICRVVDGSPNRVERLKLLGNGQVCSVTAWIGQRIMEHERAGG